MEKFGLLDDIATYQDLSVEYVDGLQTVPFGFLSSVEIEFKPKIKTLTSMAMLPEDFQKPNLNILPIQFLRQYGCVLDFRETKPRVFFRRTKMTSGKPSSFGSSSS